MHEPYCGIPDDASQNVSSKGFWKSNPYENFYTSTNGKTSFGGMGHLEQLIQLLRIVHDGDLISKPSRDALVKAGLVSRMEGFQIINSDGIGELVKLGILRP